MRQVTVGAFAGNAVRALLLSAVIFVLAGCVVTVRDIEPSQRRSPSSGGATTVRTYPVQTYEAVYMTVDAWGAPMPYVPVSLFLVESGAPGGQGAWYYTLTNDRGLCSFQFRSGDYGAIYVNYMETNIRYPDYYRENLFFDITVIDFKVPAAGPSKGRIEYEHRDKNAGKTLSRSSNNDDATIGVKHSALGRDFIDLYEDYDEGSYYSARTNGDKFLRKYSGIVPQEYLDAAINITDDAESRTKKFKNKKHDSRTRSKEERKTRIITLLNAPLAPKTSATPSGAGRGSVAAPVDNRGNDANRFRTPSAATPATPATPAAPATPGSRFGSRGIERAPSAATPATPAAPAVPATPGPRFGNRGIESAPPAATPATPATPVAPATPGSRFGNRGIESAPPAATPATPATPVAPATPGSRFGNRGIESAPPAATPATPATPAAPAAPGSRFGNRGIESAPPAATPATPATPAAPGSRFGNRGIESAPPAATPATPATPAAPAAPVVATPAPVAVPAPAAAPAPVVEAPAAAPAPAAVPATSGPRFGARGRVSAPAAPAAAAPAISETPAASGGDEEGSGKEKDGEKDKEKEDDKGEADKNPAEEPQQKGGKRFGR
ncbi:MAG: hypothetical protein OEV59_06565 [Deltaproteobacteria bacterium]|nr:hypothetical protein [Deltaproteobacteria bacterium]